MAHAIMIETAIAALYVIWGILLFKLDCDYNVTGFLTPFCFEGAGFELHFIFYAAFGPFLIIYGILYHSIRLFKYVFKIK